MVDGNISDLFFNTEHERSEGGGYTSLIGEAKDLIGCLHRLGIATPTEDELVADFYDRL